jgi:hypothetical protein
MVHTKLDKQLIANFFERKNMTVKYTAALEKKLIVLKICELHISAATEQIYGSVHLDVPTLPRRGLQSHFSSSNICLGMSSRDNDVVKQTT